MTPSAAYALEVLRAMQVQLEAAARAGMAALPVVPSSTIDGPRQVYVRATIASGEIDVVEERLALGVPLVTYALWRDTWTRVATIRRPLGDGPGAVRDPDIAARMPSLSAGLTAVTTVLLTVQTTGWHPPVQPVAIAATTLAAVGLVVSTVAALARARR